MERAPVELSGPSGSTQEGTYWEGGKATFSMTTCLQQLMAAPADFFISFPSLIERICKILIFDQFCPELEHELEMLSCNFKVLVSPIVH